MKIFKKIALFITIVSFTFLVSGCFLDTITDKLNGSCSRNDQSNSDNDEIINYTIEYDSNGATSGNVPSSSEHGKGVEVVVAGNTGNLEKTGYSFLGWNSKSDGTGNSYTPGTTILVNNNIKLYAEWNEIILSSVKLTKIGLKVKEVDDFESNGFVLRPFVSSETAFLNGLAIQYGESGQEEAQIIKEAGEVVGLVTIEEVDYLELPLDEYLYFNLESLEYYNKNLTIDNILNFKLQLTIEIYVYNPYGPPEPFVMSITSEEQIISKSNFLVTEEEFTIVITDLEYLEIGVTSSDLQLFFELN